MKNGCIFLISARKNLLHKCLTYLDINYNNKFNYPILIFYHGKKYDDLQFQQSIQNINQKTKVSFHKLEAKLPEHIKEKDLFYNRTEIEYVRNSFSKQRLGYLHANYFWNNFMNFKELKQYDYMIRIDDDSWFKNPINFDMFEELDKSGKLCGCAYTWNYVHKRVLDTRKLFYDWIKLYVSKNNIEIKNEILKNSILEGKNDIIDNRKCNIKFHTMDFLCGNCNIYNRKMFESEDWKKFNDDFNQIAGGYRYRWGDCEVISMYYYLFIGPEFLNLNLKEKGLYHDQIDNNFICVYDKDI